ncbi:transketolase [Gilvimarinus sp. F26214L]|uniref:transketolase n=1 Tax=Gilvimarinus sp. DZF01 TaxID=3461371 RepID=UPI004045BB3C
MPARNELANAIRVLSMDAVQQANSGHPGAPMGMADIAEVLWNDYLQHNPKNPAWPDRDRFVLSNGHGSMLIYSLLHLTGYDVSVEDLKNFRQWHSKTPGHPEYGDTPGVETTTGPLGQGFANAVGMALAEKVLAAQFNRDDHRVVDHYTYVFMGDGCMMEGISHEVASLAGTQALGKLIAFYDDNGISIDGEVQGWFTDDTPARFESYGWHVLRNVDGHDSNAIKQAIEAARAESDKPTLICCKTVIGFGSPNKQGKESCHGAALGADEVALCRTTLAWEHTPFEIPADIYEDWNAEAAGAQAESAWQERFEAYRKAHPELAAEFERRVVRGELPAEFAETAQTYIEQCQAEGGSVATRKASQNTLGAYGPVLPEMIGGSADLAASNLTLWPGSKGVSPKDASGNYIYYGVREFGMSAIGNGIVLHGGFLHYSATFLVFMEYARNAVRMAALMKQPHIFVYTHDSIGLGEDGPTHQPIEQLTSLRTTPNLHTWRPCDAVETAVCWRSAIETRTAPSALIFSRQGLATQPRTQEQVSQIARGGYVLKDCEGEPEVILIATGSEVDLAMQAAAALDRRVRVVSMPCAEIFEQQDRSYRESVLPASVRTRVAIEAGHVDYWRKYVGLDGDVIGMNSFGASAPGNVLFEKFGFTVDNVVERVKALL